MTIGLLTIDLFIPASGSLKGKRRVIKSIKTRIGNKFNVSISEIGYQDKWQRSVLGIVAISTEDKRIHQIFSGIVKMVENNHEVEISVYNIEML